MYHWVPKKSERLFPIARAIVTAGAGILGLTLLGENSSIVGGTLIAVGVWLAMESFTDRGSGT